TDGEVLRCLESTAAVAEQHAHATAIHAVREVTVGDSKVEEAISVHITHSHRLWTDPGVEAPRLPEGAVAIAQEHADVFVKTKVIVAAEAARDGEVENAIAVDISHRHGLGAAPGVEVTGLLEGAVAVAQENGYSAFEGAIEADCGQIKDTVSVDIP